MPHLRIPVLMTMIKPMSYPSVLAASFLLATLLCHSPARAQAQLQPLASDLGIVWGMAFVSDTTLLFTERSGKAGLLDTATGQVQWLSGLPEVKDQGQGGLLD